ncbi:MAG: hypothetical protein H5T64_09205 [Chloroflexi bacterium]|nr:hypothetical protein [Chloroflexota bacterium]
MAPDDILSVRLDKIFHQQEVTARLFHELPTYPSRAFSPQVIWNAYTRVYGRQLGRWDWLEAIWPYFERWGVR